MHLATTENFGVDENGFFGDFGGMFVPEMLYPNINELRQRYLSIMESEEFQVEYSKLLRDYVGRPSPLFLSENLSRRFGHRIFFKARGFKSHGFSQDQQRDWPGSDRKEIGKNENCRGNRCRATRSRDRDCVCSPRNRVHDLHGCGRCRASTSERGENQNARCKSSCCSERIKDAEGCDKRGDASLDRTSGRHSLSHRLGSGSASIPRSRRSFATGDRRGGPRSAFREDRIRISRRSDRLRRRWKQCNGSLRCFSR